jgi:hypothetical protein
MNLFGHNSGFNPETERIIPGAFTEDKINVVQLKQLLDESINTDAETERERDSNPCT